MTGLFLAAAAAALAAAPSSAPPTMGPTIAPAPGFTAPAGSRVSVRFAPPLGTPIRYLREESEGGRVYRHEIVVSFEQAEGGYRMHAAPVGTTLGLPPRLQLALQPVTIRLAPDGTFIGVEDLEGYRRGSDVLLGQWRADKALAGEAAKLRARNDALRGLSGGTAAYALAAAYAPVTLMSQLEVRVGDTLRFGEAPGYTPAVPEEQLTRSMVFTPASASATRLRMEVTATYDAAASRRIAERLGGEAAATRLKATDGRVVERVVHEEAIGSGLALLHESRSLLQHGGIEEPLTMVRLTRTNPKVP